MVILKQDTHTHTHTLSGSHSVMQVGYVTQLWLTLTIIHTNLTTTSTFIDIRRHTFMYIHNTHTYTYIHYPAQIYVDTVHTPLLVASWHGNTMVMSDMATIIAANEGTLGMQSGLTYLRSLMED